MEYLFRGRSSHYRKSTVVKCIYNVYANDKYSCLHGFYLKLISSHEVWLFMLYYFFTPSKEGIVREPSRNSGIISPRFAIFRWRIVEADARDARDISRRYDSVNLIPYRTQRDMAIYHCSMFRVTETFMDVVRAAAYYLPRILLFNIV